MTRSTSDVAVCCSSASVRSSVRWRSSLSSRVFSMAMTAWAAKFLHQLDLLVGERTHLLPVNDNCADHVVVLQHWEGNQSSRADKIDRGFAQSIPERRRRRDVDQVVGFLRPLPAARVPILDLDRNSCSPRRYSA